MNANLQRRLGAALGPDALQTTAHGGLRIAARGNEAVRRAVEILAEERAAFVPVGEGRTVRAAVEVQAPRGVFDLWPDELVVRVGAGTSVAELDAVLHGHGLCLGVADGAAPSTSLGSLFASGDRGLRGAVGEGLRERSLAISLVDGTGTVRRSGSRVVKSVAGFDLTRLHHGARGSLGVILDLTLRVSARPPAAAVVALHCEQAALVETLTFARSVAQDSKAELWINAAVSAAAGLGDRPHLVLLREAPADGIAAWARALGSSVHPTGLLREIAIAGWSEDVASFRIAGVTLRRFTTVAEEALREGKWVVDLLAAEAWCTNPLVPVTLDAAFAGPGTSLWAENESARRSTLPAGDAVRARTERRLRAVFDPFGLLPSPPVPRVGSALVPPERAR